MKGAQIPVRFKTEQPRTARSSGPFAITLSGPALSDSLPSVPHQSSKQVPQEL
jgi:hypothetical protein